MADIGTLTAPLAIIKVDGKPVGKVKTVNCQEQISRGRIVGIGSITPSELPALNWTGIANFSEYLIEYKNDKIKSGLTRNVNSVEDFVNSILLAENGVQVDIMRRVAIGPPDPITGIIPVGFEVFASIKGMFITRSRFNIQESQISGKDTDFEYTTPIIYPQ